MGGSTAYCGSQDEWQDEIDNESNKWITVKPKRSCYNTHTSSLSKIPPKLTHKIVKEKGDSAA